jgi:hypothetical protein
VEEEEGCHLRAEGWPLRASLGVAAIEPTSEEREEEKK